MRFLTSKKGIASIIFILVILFGADQSGVFGETKIGVTLKSNSALNEGLIAHYTFDAQTEQGWVNFSNGGATTSDHTSGSDIAYGVVVDNEGYVYVTGDCNGCDGGGDDIYTYKLDPTNGGLVWGTTSEDGSSSPSDIAADNNDHIYTTGRCQNCGVNGSNAFWTIKRRTSDGLIIWENISDPTSGFDDAESVAVDNSGDVYVTGDCDNCGSVSDGIYTIKIDGDTGQTIWSTTTDPTDNGDFGRAIAIDEEGFPYVGGYCDGCGPIGQFAKYLLKLDPDDGSVIWATTTDYTSLNDTYNGLVVGDDGFLYSAGACRGCGSQGNDALITTKLSRDDGSIIWATTTDPTNGQDQSADITYGPNGDLIFVGKCAACGSFGGDAWYTYKVDSSDGSMLWATTTDPSTDDDEPTAVSVDAIGNVYVAGWCEGCGNNGFHAHYVVKMNGDDGTMIDSNTTDSFINIGGEYVPGNVGQGMEFDGVDDFVEVNDSFLDGVATMTIAAWIKPQGTGPSFYQRFVHSGGDNQPSPALIYRSDTSRIRFEHDTDSATGFWETDAQTARENRWMHVAVTYDNSLNSNDPIIYLDGVEVNLTEVQAPTGNMTDSSGEFRIGDRVGGGTNFNGVIDDVRVYNRLLPPDEITRLYQLGATTKINKTLDTNPDLKRGLLNHYTFDGSDAYNSFIDNGSIGYDASLHNGSLVPTSTTPGVIGQALYLPGENQGGVRASTTANLTEVSLCTWVVFDSFDNADSDIQLELLSRFNDWRLFVNVGSQTFDFQYITDTTYPTVEGNITLDINTWYHVCAVHFGIGTNPIMYINGIDSSTAQIAGSGSQEDGSASVFDIGNSTGNIFAYNHFGALDDVRVYNRPLSAQEVTRLYELGATTKINKTIDTNPDLKRGLVGHWSFDGKKTNLSSTTGEILDSSSTNVAGDITGLVSPGGLFEPGKLGQAGTFDGVDDDITIPHRDVHSFGNGTGDQPFSAGGWAKIDPSMPNTDFPIVVKYTDTSPWTGEWYIAITPDQFGSPGNDQAFVQLLDGNATTRIRAQSIESMPRDEWVHVFATYDGSESETGLTLYVNGEAVAIDQNEQGVYTAMDNEGGATTIGSSIKDSGFDSWAHGEIDDVRIYNRALSPAEVLRLYELGN